VRCSTGMRQRSTVTSRGGWGLMPRRARLERSSRGAQRTNELDAEGRRRIIESEESPFLLAVRVVAISWRGCRSGLASAPIRSGPMYGQ
jgi:hypothetical protein